MPTYPKSLQAALQRMDMTVDPTDMMSAKKPSSWQADAWRAYEKVGELSSVCGWLANSASRVTLYAAEVDDTTGSADVPSDNKLAVDIVRGMAGGWSGQSDMLRQSVILLTIVGEFYIAITLDDTGAEEWKVVPADRVSTSPDGSWQINLNGAERTLDPDTESIFRVWRPHPRRPEEADSSVRSALPILEEIQSMDAVITAAARSRTSGAGLLIVPSETQFPDTQKVPGQMGAPPRPGSGAARFGKQLYDVMSAALEDQSSPQALSPIVLTVPGEHANNFRHLTLDTDIEEKAVSTRDRAIQRLALSLDIPPEVLTGLGDSTHWNANLVNESALKQHIAPLMTTVCEALTTAVLQPMLEHTPGAPLHDRTVVGFDMTALTQSSDKSDYALDAFSAGLITAAAARREFGFDDGDAPAGIDQRELAIRMVTRAPSLLPQLAHILGLEPPEGGWKTVSSRDDNNG